ncbi:hypothetical protein CA54_48330 [Symmachiella macrocystis]|uniref:Zinc finger/thioredoxin putative domain-containing protein n=1 Tax=Symmachiella macrocystis TaxID=2527985 RepID=A0A5C6BDP9_9PLAN|nr:hypothetical protein CA54_48330 [Symmachiella macrocystis]
MSTIDARCPKCKSVFRLKDASLAGKKIKCRKCQAPFVVQPITSGGGGARRKTNSSVDPYGREISFSKTGELPVSGRKIKKIQRVSETEEPEADEPDEFGQPAAPKRRLKPRGKKGKAKSADKGKRKKKKAQTTKLQKIIAVAGGVVLLSLIILGAVFGPSMAKRIAESGKLVAPKQYLVYEPADGEVMIEYPEGWDISHGGGHSNKLFFLRINHAGLEVFIVEFDPQKEAMNVAMTGGQSRFNNPDKAPSYAVHQRRLKEIQESNTDFEESPPKEMLTGFGIAQYSKFTDPGLIFGSTTGYRMTLYDPDGGKYNAYFRCSPKQFDTAKPIFEHMMGTIAPANADDA